MRREKFIDLRSLLSGANLAVAASIALVFGQADDNPYLDRNSLLLGLLLCVQTQLALWQEKRRRDPLVILLAIEMIIYYGLRLVTLTLYPFSAVFDRYIYEPADTNRALVFILIANLFLYGGLFFAKSGDFRAITAAHWRATSPGRTVALLMCAVIVGYSSISYDPDSASNLASLLSFFFEPSTVIMMALAYYLLFRRSLSRMFALTIASLIVVEMAMHTLAGSRSAIVGFIENGTIVILAIAGCIRIPRRYFAPALILSPAMLALLFISFAISTYNRAHRETGVGAAFDLNQALATAMQYGADLELGPSLDLVLPPMFARTGYFDFSAEIIAHRAEYSGVLNLPTYAESIVDNILTPGFDVYDQPKIGNSLQFVYRELGRPSKEVLAEIYQSDQLGIYGELYAWCGYGSLPLFFLIAYLLKRIFVRVRGVNPFTLAMKRVVVLFVFVGLLHSFGVDWVILQAIPLAAAIYIYGYFFAAKRAPPPPPATAAPPLRPTVAGA